MTNLYDAIMMGMICFTVIVVVLIHKRCENDPK